MIHIDTDMHGTSIVLMAVSLKKFKQPKLQFIGYFLTISLLAMLYISLDAHFQKNFFHVIFLQAFLQDLMSAKLGQELF